MTNLDSVKLSQPLKSSFPDVQGWTPLYLQLGQVLQMCKHVLV